MKAAWLLGGLVLAAVSLAGAAAQDLGTLQAPVKTKQYIQYAAEQQVVAAGKTAALELRFRVVDGYHVNSHVPKSDLQLPTVVELAADTGVKVGAAEYPSGKAYSFSFAPEQKLDVYQDEFVVRLPVVGGGRRA